MKNLNPFSKLIIPLICFGGILYYNLGKTTESNREAYESFLNKHEFLNRQALTPADIKKMPKKDRPDLAAELNFIKTMDPSLQRPTPEALVDYMMKNQRKKDLAKTIATPGSEDFPWEERGPSKVGGRTRAIMYDPNDATYNKVWAGGVSGGLWYNDSIYNDNSTWVNVSEFWSNIPISCITYDPQNTNIFYVGTGEGYGTAAAGAGVWKTEDGGVTWEILPNSIDYRFILDITVSVENDTSRLYVAASNEYYQGTTLGQQGVYKSSDGGATFELTQSTTNSNIGAISDFEISAVDSALWAANAVNGKIFKYNKNLNKWKEIYDIPSGDRVEIALSKQDSNKIYAVYASGSQVGGIVKSLNGGTTWTNVNEPADPDGGIPATDFSRGQAWYDLTIEVDPNDDNVVFVGGINIHKSTDGGTNWNTLTQWFGSGSLNVVHADQHNMIFKPNSSDTCLFSNDGGVFYTKSATFTGPAFYARNNGYNVTQFYATDLHGTDEYYLAGSQDNGTQKFEGLGFVETDEVTGGDGGYCFVDKVGNPRYITSYVYNNFYTSTNGTNFFDILNENTGLFINPATYDDVHNVLFSAKTSSRIISYHFNGPIFNGVEEMQIPGMGSVASAFAVNPHNTDSTILLIGSLSGRVVKVSGANQSNFTVESIHSSAMPSASVSSIVYGHTEDEILVTYSNYGVNSVWYTNDGGDSWESIEGDLPNIPVRSSLINPYHNNRAIVATDLGVWVCDDIHASSPEWTQSINGLQNVRVDMLRTRSSDHKIAAATFGRGLFTGTFIGTEPAMAEFTSTSNVACIGESISFESISENFIDSVKWSVTPNTFDISAGTDTSNIVEFTFNASGTYQIQLIAYNATQPDTVVHDVEIATFNTPDITRHFNELTCTETGTGYQWILNGSSIPGATNQTYTMSQNGTYRVEVTNGNFCKLKSPGFVVENVSTDELEITEQIEFISGESTINLLGVENKEYTVFVTDMLGKSVLKSKAIGSSQIQVNKLPTGVYSVVLESKGNIISTTKISKL
ncbi:MAG: T9SS type A sorting domain-containing protein [Flavobacteriales bacterium]